LYGDVPFVATVTETLIVPSLTELTVNVPEVTSGGALVAWLFAPTQP
jgi:hypothetical protein